MNNKTNKINEKIKISLNNEKENQIKPFQKEKNTTNKKKKIVICTQKKDNIETLIDKVKGETDFIKAISKLLKVSSRCQKCEYINISNSTEYYCTNFEALWYHRDTRFTHFANCTHHKEKNKSVLSSKAG